MGREGGVNPSAVHNFGKDWKTFLRTIIFFGTPQIGERFLASLGMTTKQREEKRGAQQCCAPLGFGPLTSPEGILLQY
jgi:hypothetical protein